jgi:hypothetical protein
MFSEDQDLWPDLVDPVADHPSNAGRLIWLCALPDLAGGSKFIDLMGSTNGTLNNMAAPGTATSGWGATARPGGWNQLNFDGVNDNVTFTGLETLNGTSSTVATWIRVASYPNNSYLFFGTTTGGNCFWWLYGTTYIYIAGIPVPIAATNWSDGKWRHLVLTAGPTTMTAYINGAQVGSAAGPGTSLGSGPKNWMLGDWIGSPGGGYNAPSSFDDFTVANRAWSSAEALSHYELSLQSYPGPLRRTDPAAMLAPAGGGGGGGSPQYPAAILMAM